MFKGLWWFPLNLGLPHNTAFDPSPPNRQEWYVMVCAPSNASPGSSVCHPLTDPGSIHSMFLNPSLGAKSPMPAALSVQGFHTTTLARLSRVTVNAFFPPSSTLTASLDPFAGVYTRSVSPVMVSGLAGCVLVFAPSTLSTKEALSRPEMETAAISFFLPSSAPHLTLLTLGKRENIP